MKHLDNPVGFLT